MSHWSRDNARTPMQWSSEINAGFSKGDPWLAINDNYKKINVEKELQDSHSILNFYKKLIALRKNESAFTDGDFELILDNDPNVFAYLRKNSEQEYLVISNLSDGKRTVTLPRKVVQNVWRTKLTNDNTLKISKNMTLQPYAVTVMEKIN